MFVKVLLIAHAICSLTLLGVATHNGILALYHLFGDFRRPVLQKRYAAVLFWLYWIAFIGGVIIYPIFRVAVRAAYFDSSIPLATGFFEVKEHWLALGLALLLWYYPASRRIDIRAPQSFHRFYHLAGVALMLIVWFAAVTGLALVSLRSI